ncbi:MAG TPA: PDZ domain-containing protein [Marmoricola sp.]|nr:PDZ domain-containing protein [Marmoricola sp.]
MTVRRRFWAARWLALSLAVAGVLALSLLPMPYVVFSPGPTVNVLGKVDGHQVIQIEGRQTYRDSGDLRLTTVVVSSQSHKVNLFELLQAWFTPDHAIYPREVVYHKGDTNKSVQQQNAAEMTSSQDAAVAAALTELEIPITQVVKVLGVTPDGPSEGLLQIGDVVLAVDGRPVADSQDVINQVQARKIGDQVKLLVRREVAPKEKSDQSKQQDPPRSVEKTITVTTRAAATKPVKPIIGVVIGRGYEFPFTVDLGVGDSIGGPSGGLTFALGIYDLLTPGSLTGGKDIAGTGEINPDGRVGSIGGIQQKIAAAQGDGARLFLVPPDNCAEAVRANYDPKKMRLVRAETLDSAIKSLEAWSVDQSAKLPTCAKK